MAEKIYTYEELFGNSEKVYSYDELFGNQKKTNISSPRKIDYVNIPSVNYNPIIAQAKKEEQEKKLQQMLLDFNTKKAQMNNEKNATPLSLSPYIKPNSNGNAVAQTITPEQLKMVDKSKGDLWALAFTDYEDKAEHENEKIRKDKLDAELEQTKKASLQANINAFKIANEEWKKQGKPSLSDEGIEQIKQLLEENIPSPSDNRYIKAQKANNMKLIGYTYGAMLDSNYQYFSQMGVEKSESALSGAGLKEKHSIINGTQNANSSTRLYTQLTEQEKQNWNYYIGRNDTEKALEYLDVLTPALEARLAETVSKEYDEQGVWGDVKQIGTVALGGLEKGVYDMASSIYGTTEIMNGNSMADEFVPGFFSPSQMELFTNKMLANEDGEDGRLFNIILSAINSTVYQTPSLLVSAAGGGMAGYVLQSVGANTTQAIRANSESFSDVIYGVYEGAMEWLVDRTLGGISSQLSGKGASSLTKSLLNKVDDVLKNPTVKKWLSKGVIGLTTVTSENLEEMIQFIADPLARAVIYGKELDYSEVTLANMLELLAVTSISTLMMSPASTNATYNQHRAEVMGQSIIDTGKVDTLLQFAQDFDADKGETYDKVWEAKENNTTPDALDVAALYSQAMRNYNTISADDLDTLIKKSAESGNTKWIADSFFNGNTKAANKFAESRTKKAAKTKSNRNKEYIPQFADIMDDTEEQDNITSNAINPSNVNKLSIADNGNGTLDGESSAGYNESNVQLNENGGVVNAEINAQEWGQSGNSQRSTGLLQENLGGNNDQSGTTRVEQGGIQGLRSSEGGGNQRLNSEQSERLKNTAIRNDDGTPKAVYHFTENMDFETFEKGDIGFHFGNETQAKKRGDVLKQSGRIITAYLDIENPIYISSDIMSWRPRNLAIKLLSDNIISAEEYRAILAMDTEVKYSYDSPAAVELRRMLSEKGYDGIVYQNMFEGDGESYITFYPEQVIIIDDGKGGNNGGTVSSENSPLPEVSAENAETDMAQSLINDALGIENLSEGQKTLRKIGKTFGVEIGFKNLDEWRTDNNGKRYLFSPDGEYDPKTEKITLNTSKRVKHSPVAYILKHELTHSLEKNGVLYNDFADAVMESTAFKNYIKEKGFNTAAEYNADIVRQYTKKGVKNFDEGKADLEMVANFVGDMLFGGKTEITSTLIEGMEPKPKRSFIQWIKDALSYFKQKLTGQKVYVDEITQLEEKFLETVRSAQTKENTAQQDGGEKQNSINADFYDEFDAWDGKDTNKVFTIGTTSEPLQSVNIKNQEIKMRSGMIIQKLSKHPEISRQIFRDIPELLEHPIIVQFSDAIDPKTQKPKYDSRITVLGELYADMNIDGKTVRKPVLVSLELLPTNQKKTKILDVSFVTSAYGHSKLQAYLNENSILYVEPNKKRTDKWLSLNRLQLPLGENRTGPIRKITYTDGKVKIQNSTKKTEMQIALEKAGVIDSYGNSIFQDDENNSDDKQFSLTETTDADVLLQQYESGEITREEYLERLKGERTLNPVEIGRMTKEDASTTPPLEKKEGSNEGDRESKTYQSLQSSDIFSDEFKAEVKKDEFIKQYQSITNKETLLQAARELDEGGQSYVNRWNNLRPERASLMDVAVGMILMYRYQRIGDTQSAIAAAQKVREMGTAGGRQVQIFSILGRFDPNTMLAYAQKELDDAFEALVDGKSQKWIDKYKERLKLTKEDIDYIHRKTLQAARAEEGTRAKAIALAQIATRIQDKIPANIGDKIRTLQRVSMLLNPKTNVRNITGNAGMVPIFIASDFFGSMIDKQMAKKTETRTTGNFTLKGSGTAFKKGLSESWDDFKRGIRTRKDDLNRFDVNKSGGKVFDDGHGGKLAKQLNALSKKLNEIDNFTSFCLEAGDRSFFEMWMNNSLNNQLQLNNVEIPTPEMLEIARQEALQRTWQDDNKFTRTVAHIKKSLNGVHIPGTNYGLGDFVLKFVKTPSNIAKAIVDFSPMGFALSVPKLIKMKNSIETGRFTPQMQKEAVRSLSNAITGTLVYVLVAVLASVGAIELSGAGDEDKDAANFEKYVAGIAPYSINFFGTNISYDWMQPFGSVLAVVADFMESRKENPYGNVIDDIFGALKIGGQAFTEQSFLSSLYELFSSDGIIEGLVSAGFSEPAAFVPQAFSQAASFLDDKRRVSYDPTSEFKTAWNRVIAKIPGLRQTLPEQVNVLGESVSNNQFLNPWEAFVAPGNSYSKSSGKVADGIYELYKATGNKSVMPKVAPNYISVKGNKITFTPDKKMEYQTFIGKISAEILDKMFRMSEYNSLSDEQKADAVKEVYNYATARAKCELDYDYDMLSAMEGTTQSGTPYLTKAKYNSLSEGARKQMVKEYFLTKAERLLKDDSEKAAKYFIKRAKD